MAAANYLLHAGHGADIDLERAGLEQGLHLVERVVALVVDVAEVNLSHAGLGVLGQGARAIPMRQQQIRCSRGEAGGARVSSTAATT